MSCSNLDELVLEVKQGEARGFSFTINQDSTPFDLTGWTVDVQIKNAPYYQIPCMVEKIITETSDLNTVGQITQPTQGQFTLQINKEDTLYPPFDYYLTIFLTDGTQNINISGDGNYNAIYRVCTQ